MTKVTLQDDGSVKGADELIARRIAGALPAFFVKLFPQTWANEDARQSLAASEEKFWQLPPEHDEKSPRPFVLGRIQEGADIYS
jgi:hypothetical protein